MTPRAPLFAVLPLLFASSAYAGRPLEPPTPATSPPTPVAPAPAPAPAAPVIPPASATPAAPAAAAAWTVATPVGRIVAERPSAASVLDAAGIDYCCGGATPLGDAARAKGVDPAKVLASLLAFRETPAPASERNWVDAPLPDLLGHIQATHHAYLRRELPRLSVLVEKVRGVHGARHPELTEVASLYAALAKDLPPHLELEEQRLFPGLLALDSGRAAPAALADLDLMLKQHDGAGAALHRLREITKGFAVPADACVSYRQMLAGLVALEADLHTHVHLENNVVAPRAKALAKK